MTGDIDILLAERPSHKKTQDSFISITTLSIFKQNCTIYIGRPDFKNNILGNEENEYEWLNLIQVISHEGVHSQMYKDYSSFGFMKTPSWINEGYCEYISYRPMTRQ